MTDATRPPNRRGGTDARNQTPTRRHRGYPHDACRLQKTSYYGARANTQVSHVTRYWHPTTALAGRWGVEYFRYLVSVCSLKSQPRAVAGHSGDRPPDPETLRADPPRLRHLLIQGNLCVVPR